MVLEIIADQRQKPQKEENVISRLLVAVDEETGSGMSEQQLRHEVILLLLAGHETTSNGLTFTLYLLSQHPKIWRRLKEMGC